MPETRFSYLGKSGPIVCERGEAKAEISKDVLTALAAAALPGPEGETPPSISDVGEENIGKLIESCGRFVSAFGH